MDDESIEDHACKLDVEQKMDEIGIYALAQLICRLNPYTGVMDPSTHSETEDMVVGTPAASDSSPATSALLEELAGIVHQRIRSIAVEVERNYGTSWSFKGQRQSVKTAFRVPYTFEVKDMRDNTSYWQTEHVLIGFAGADGGG